jgi:hypothetical protein
MRDTTFNRQLSAALLWAVLFIAATLLMEAFVSYLFPTRPAIMGVSYLGCLAWGGIGFLYAFVSRPLNQLFVLASLVLYMIGNLNAVASYFHYGSYYLSELLPANLVYCLFAAVLVIGLIMGEKWLALRPEATRMPLRHEPSNTVFFWGCLIFPFVWIADELIALRRLPILSGESIVDSIYSLSYGRLYGYGVLLGVSALLMWSKRQTTDNKLLSTVMSALLLCTMFIMVFDGKRIFVLMFFAALIAFEVISQPDRKFWIKLFWIGVTILGLYIVVLYLRQGGLILRRSDGADMFSKVGVEYRDYVFLHSRYAAGSLPGYNWAASAVGGFGNFILLALFGLNKNELVFSGSAYQIALTLRSSFGIRIGLMPELWLNYGLWGSLIMVPIGVFFVWVSRLAQQSTTEIGRILACLVYGVLMLSFVNQTTAVTGYLSLILYLWLVWLFLESFRSKQAARTDNGVRTWGPPGRTWRAGK